MRQLAWAIVTVAVLWGMTTSDLTAGKWKKSSCAGCATPYPSCVSPYPSCATPYHCATPKLFKRGCATPYGCAGSWGCSAPSGRAGSCVGSCAGSCAVPMSAGGDWLYAPADGEITHWSHPSSAPLMTNYYQPVPGMQAPIPGVPVAEDVAW